MSSIQTSKTLAALTRAKAAVGRRQDGSAYIRTEATAKKQVSFHPQESEVTVGMLLRAHFILLLLHTDTTK